MKEFSKEWRETGALTRSKNSNRVTMMLEFESVRAHAKAVIDALTDEGSVQNARQESDNTRWKVRGAFDKADKKLHELAHQMWNGSGKGLQDLVAQLNPGEEVKS